MAKQRRPGESDDVPAELPAPEEAAPGPAPDHGVDACLRAAAEGTLLPRLGRRLDPPMSDRSAPKGVPGATGFAVDGQAVRSFERYRLETKDRSAEVEAALGHCQKQFILWDVARDELEIGDIAREPALPPESERTAAAVEWVAPLPSAELSAVRLASGVADDAFGVYTGVRDKAFREPYRAGAPAGEEGRPAGDDDLAALSAPPVPATPAPLEGLRFEGVDALKELERLADLEAGTESCP